MEAGGARDEARPAAASTSLSDAILFLAFLAVPLAVSTWTWDQFTTIKWYLLDALAAVWIALEVARGPRRLPPFLRRRGPLVALLALLWAASLLRHGPGDSLQPALDGLGPLLIALGAYWHFSREGGGIRPLRAGTLLAAAAVSVCGLAQFAGFDPLPWITAGDQLSATFGNMNMTAQFLGFAVLAALSAGRSRPEGTSRGRALAAPGVAALSLAYLFFLATRSVLIALGCGLVVLARAGILSRRRAARVAVAAAGVVALVLVLRAGAPGGRIRRADLFATWAGKDAGPIRLGLWRGTLRMIRDHPLGIGSAAFGPSALPYLRDAAVPLDERVIYRTPHNDYLRAAVEDGLPFAALGAWLAWGLLRALRRAAGPPRDWTDPLALFWSAAAYYAVEAAFQFPLGVAFGALSLATLLGFALARVAPAAEDEPPRGAWRGWGTAAGLAAAAAVAALGARVATAEYLFVAAPEDVDAQERACRLNPHDLDPCLQAAWLHAVGGGEERARALLVGVIARWPYYHPAIKMRGEEALAGGDLPTACRYLWIYDELFRGNSSVRAELRRCPASLLDGFAASIPMPVYRSFPFPAADLARARKD